MSAVTVLGPNLGRSAGATFHVHRTGCADVTRSPLYRGCRRSGELEELEVGSLQALVEDYYSDIMAENEGALAEWEAYELEFKVFPCVDLPRTTEMD